MQLKGKELRRFRRKIGMIFQSFNLVTRTKVINNADGKGADLSLSGRFGIYPKRTSGPEALDKVGFWTRRLCADQLSGGQQQRVALARTLAQNRRSSGG